MASDRTGICLLLGAVLLGCGPKDPPSWAAGGAQLVVGPARWDREDDEPIEIQKDGKVLEDGDFIFLLDVAGRVVDENYDPVAILLPDGQLVGTDDVYLGRVGLHNASPPDRDTAWLAVLPDGQVQRFDYDGERSSDGVWRGCDGARVRACTLVTQIISLRSYRGRSGGFHFGVGVGVVVAP